MLSKEERKELNTSFWEGFRKEMRSTKSCNGRNINWINYPTDVKDVYIRMEADNNGARFCFDIQPKDEGIRSILYEQMTELKKVMEDEVGEATSWNEFDRVFAGRNVSRILWSDDTLNFYKNEDRAQIKTFFREKLLAFDSFYQEFKDILIALAE
jgi:hypothetical protein